MLAQVHLLLYSIFYKSEITLAYYPQYLIEFQAKTACVPTKRVCTGQTKRVCTGQTKKRVCTGQTKKRVCTGQTKKRVCTGQTKSVCIGETKRVL
jgi:hypothetical protein